MKFNYPISVIAGRNGSGKSTILAMAACAFHNHRNGFKLPERKLPYYTFSDFFVQTSEEVPPEGIEIWYRIRHDKWKRSRQVPNSVGNLWQRRKKKRGGKWNKYSHRVNRNIIFFGIQRVVPHSEKTVSKSYRSYFTDAVEDGWEDDVKSVVGRILSTEYDAFWMKRHSRYSIPLVASHGTVYSGFNMGAGENALFGIFSTIFACPPGALMVIDEIELGLHEDAQRKFIRELKKVCKDRHIQVICTTHSPAILEAVPPEGRFFVENYPTRTVVTPGISPRYAAGKLSGRKSYELDIYVEDGIAGRLVEAVLPADIRKRISIIPIGSPAAIVRQMAARYKDRRTAECLCVLDGDQSGSAHLHTRHFLDALERRRDSETAARWFENRLSFLPGNTWPERWIIEQLKEADLGELAELFKISEEELAAYIEEAALAGKHNELYNLSENLSLEELHVSYAVSRWIADENSDAFIELREAIDDLFV
jgi:energy-coupling factor transporter ATP-binding protein EcfA2